MFSVGARETHENTTHLEVGIHQDPFRKEACQGGKGAHLGVPSCLEGACHRASEDGLYTMRMGKETKSKSTHRREEVHQTVAAHHNPWAGRRQMEGQQEGLDAEDQTRIHQGEEDYRSRMQL